MKQSHIAIIGAPMDLGAGRRGVDMGPSALRLAGLNEKLTGLGYEVEDLGNVVVDQPESRPVGNPDLGRRGVDMGPSALRLAGLNEKLTGLGYEVEDLGNVVVDQPESLPVGNP